MAEQSIKFLSIDYDDDRPAYTAVFEHDEQYYYANLCIIYDLGEEINLASIGEKYANNGELALLIGGEPMLVIYESDKDGNVPLEQDGLPTDDSEIFRKACKEFSEECLKQQIEQFFK